MVGRHLKPLLPGAYYPTSSEYDLTQYAQTNAMFEAYKPDLVVHIAARVAGLNGNLHDNYRQLYVNSVINMNVIEHCRLHKVKKVINILSTCVFPDKVEYPLKSEYLLDGPSHESNEGYSASKRLLFTAGKWLSSEYDIQVINLIPTNLYGEHDNYSPKTSHVIPAIIRKVVEAKRYGGILKMQGSGKPLRQFMYAGDFARIIALAATNTFTGNFHSVITAPPASFEISIKDLYAKICKVCDFTGHSLSSGGPDGQYRKSCDNHEMQRYDFLHDFKFTSLDDGLERTVKAFKDLDLSRGLP